MKRSVIIAGATGLVGGEILGAFLQSPNIETVYTLSRRKIDREHNKLRQIIDDDLNVPANALDAGFPDVGIIALGSTIKKAGTKERLRAIDVDLVVSTAENMKALGVKHLIAVSCIGADTNALSHYLRCKGEMEAQVESLDFDKTTFLHPGPLAGNRHEQRSDEKLLQCTLKFFRPLMLGRLKKYLPIQAVNIAKSVVVHSMFPASNKVERLDSLDMMKLVS